MDSTAKAHGCRADLEIRQGYPHVHNDVALTSAFKTAAIDYLGADRVHDLDIRMTGEDFSYFANEIPGCFYRLGTVSSKKQRAPYFTPASTSTDALRVGAGLMAYSAATVDR